MVTTRLPATFTLLCVVAPAAVGSGRYRSGSGTGVWLVLIGPIQLPLPLTPGEPLKSIVVLDDTDTVPLPVVTPPSGALESTIKGAPTTLITPLPTTVSAPGLVGSRSRIPMVPAFQPPSATARAR